MVSLCVQTDGTIMSSSIQNGDPIFQGWDRVSFPALPLSENLTKTSHTPRAAATNQSWLFQLSYHTVFTNTVEPWITSIIRSRRILVIQSTRILERVSP